MRVYLHTGALDSTGYLVETAVLSVTTGKKRAAKRDATVLNGANPAPIGTFHFVRNEKVAGSILVGSTILPSQIPGVSPHFMAKLSGLRIAAGFLPFQTFRDLS